MEEDVLRRRAEQIISEQLEGIHELHAEDIRNLIHELQVHQVELEMQNDELRKAHLELEASRVKYYELYDFAPVGYFTLSENGIILEVNLAGAELLGVGRRYVIGSGFSRFLAPESQDRFYYYRTQARETGLKQDCEIKIIRKGGINFYAQLQMFVRVADENETAHFHVTATDISKRKHAEDELRKSHEFLEQRVEERTASLRESEAKYRELVQNANSIIYYRDPQGHITFFNEYAQSFFGYDEAEILGKHVVGTIVPENDERGRNLALLIENISRNPDRYASNINENMRRNGERVWVSWTNTAIRDEHGDVEGILCVGNDITALRKARKALTLSEERYRILADNVSDIIWTVDLGLHFTYISPSVERILGYTRKEITTHVVDRILPPESRKSALELAEKFKKFIHHTDDKERFRDPKTVELRMIRKDGTLIWTETTLTFVGGTENNADTILGVTRDTTDRVLARQSLEQSKMELESESRHLAEANTTLKVLMNRIKEDKMQFEENVLSNIRELVIPFIEKLKVISSKSERDACIQVLEANLHNIASPFLRNMSLKHYHLTPKELQVANLVKEGKTTKEIAELLNASARSVEFHRDNIRKKLNIKHKKKNLRSNLLAMSAHDPTTLF